jgi:hypothetical protein
MRFKIAGQTNDDFANKDDIVVHIFGTVGLLILIKTLYIATIAYGDHVITKKTKNKK